MTNVMRLLDPEYQDVLDASCLDDLKSTLVRFADRLGFPFVSGLTVVDTQQSGPIFHSIDNVPDGYRPYYADPSIGRRNHVMQHCKSHSTPIAWDQSSYVDAGNGEVWETQARFGYKCGVCMPLHLSGGRHFVFGVVRVQPLPLDRREMTHVVTALYLFGAHAEETAWRLHGLVSNPAQVPSKLTPRELECLRWTMEGKTAWELGRILNIAENTVVRHLHSAMRKLDCVSKHHAVIQALRRKLIW